MTDINKIPLFDKEGVVIGLVSYLTNLHTHASHFYQGIGKTTDDRFFACAFDREHNPSKYAIILTETEAEQIVLKYDANLYKDLFGTDPPILDE